MRTIRYLVRIGLLIVAAHAAGAQDGLAQNPLDHYVGQQIRVTAPAIRMHEQKALLVGTRSDTLVLTTDTELTVAVADVVRLDVLRGRKSKTWAGAGIGFLVGGVAGFAIGLASGDDPPGWFSYTAEQKAVAGGVVLGLAGGLVGGIVGAVSKTDQWEEIPSDRFRVSLLPAHRGIGIGGRIAF
jgi:hypothetical protein